jgi:hypothetical protein
MPEQINILKKEFEKNGIYPAIGTALSFVDASQDPFELISKKFNA